MRSHAVMSSKGQIVIPANFRKRFGMRAGTTVIFQEERGRLVLEPSNYAALYALRGSLRGLPLEADLDQDRQAAREREDQQR